MQMMQLYTFVCVVYLMLSCTECWLIKKGRKRKCDGQIKHRDCPKHCGLHLIPQLCCARESQHYCAYMCYGVEGTCQNGGSCIYTDTCKCPSGGYDLKCADIDECIEGNGGCEQSCTNTVGSYKCSCSPGHVLDNDGLHCSDLNECLEANGGCEHNCVNHLGSYTCECKPGYLIENKACKDIDECEGGVGSCEHKCENTIGSFSCSCDEGYILLSDGLSCAPVCEEGEFGVCPHGGVCVQPGVCNCTDGFSPPHCEDIDECAEGNDCDHICVNEMGYFRCECRNGFELLPDKRSCADIDECAEGNDCDHICVNEMGYFRCECRSGFELLPDERSCSDIDECAEGNDCDHICVNEMGHFRCECRNGFELLPDKRSCADIDECAEGNDCYHICVNEMGHFRCECRNGFELLPDKRSCAARCNQDWDLGQCPNGGTCVSPGVCACLPGFQLPTCTNIDECSFKNGGCAHICTDTEGSYICSCKTGFTTEGKLCTDVDECRGSHDCSDICVNTQGSFTCQCNPGYELSSNNTACVDRDECSDETSGCDQICKNTRGSYECGCHKGFIMGADGKQCVELRECDSEEEVGCRQICTPGPGEECTCPEGLVRQTGGDYCVDLCWSSPCSNGGRCVAGGTDESISCECSGTGFRGDSCEMGHLEIPSSLTVSKGVLHPNISIKALAVDDVIIWVSSDSDVSVYPNPIGLQGPEFTANISILTRTPGNLELVFNTSHPRISPSLYRMRVQSDDVFRRLRLHKNSVPKGCYYLTVTMDVEEHTFSSTSPWYRRKTENRVQYTFGVTHYIYLRAAIPLSIDGLRVTHGTSVRISDPPRDVDADDVIRHHDFRDERCQEVSFSSVDLEDFKLSRSLMKSLCESLKGAVPYWLRLILFESSTLGESGYRSQILAGREVRHNPLCKSTLTEDDIAYIVILFSDGFSLDFLGQQFRIPPATDNKQHCLVLDFRHTDSLAIVLNSDTSGILEKIPFAAEILQKSGIKVYPKLFSISNGWSLQELYDHHLTFYDGSTMFDYRFPDKIYVHAGLMADKVISTSGGFDFAVHTTANLFSDRNPEYLFTHLNARPLDIFIHFNSLTASMTMRIWGKDVRFDFANILDGDRAVLATGGDANRDICGREANPHGVYAQAKLQTTPFPSLHIISTFVLMAETEAYFFLTFDDRKDTIMGWTKSAVDSLLAVVRKKALNFQEYANSLKKTKAQSLTLRVIDDIKETLRNIVDLAQTFDTTNITTTYFGDLSRNVRKNAFKLADLVERLESEAKMEMNEAMLSKMSTIKRYLQLVDGATKNVWWTMFDGSQPYYPDSHTWGVKSPITITVLGNTLVVDATFILSPENFMACSSLYEYYDHVQGGNATRIVGIITFSKASETFLKTQALRLLWQFFPTYEGAGFELALSKTEPLFTARIQVFFRIFGIQISTSLFITNHEIVGMVEANVWDIFRARLRVGAVIPYTLEDLAIWVKGDFLPGTERSLESSFWEAVGRVIETRKKTVMIRLRMAKVKAQSAHDALTHSQNDISAAKGDLDSKQTAFDKAVERLEAAKMELEKAKKPFKKSNRKLTKMQEAVDRLCTLQNCDRCVKKVTRTNCKSNRQKTCVKTVPCGYSFGKMSCKAKNAACRAARAVAIGGLYIARAAVVLPIIALDAAKGAVSLAQIIVDKSRVVLDIAKGLYTAANFALEVGKTTLSLAEKAIDSLKIASNKLFQLAKHFIQSTLQKILDIKNCGFEVELSYRNWFELSAYCKINFLSRGWEKYTFSLNFKDILGSMLGIAKSSVNIAEKKISERRRKRSSDVLEDKETDGYNSHILDHNSNDTVLEAETWSTRCERFNAIAFFLNTSLGVLKNLSRDVIEEANALEREISADEEEDFRWESFYLTDTSIDPLVALEDFNLTREDLEVAINASDLRNDQYLKESAEFSSLVTEQNAAEIERVRRSYVIQEWVQRMEERHYNGDCLGFPDCISWSFGEIRGLLDSVRPDLVSSMFEDLAALESHFQKVLQNDSSTANDTVDLELDFTVMRQLSDFLCETIPVVIAPPANSTVALGLNAEFLCLAESSSSVMYYWYKDRNLTLSGQQVTVFTVQNVTEQDESDYTCVAGNHIGNTSAQHFHLRVVQPPKIMADLPDKINLYEGVEVTVSVNVTGIPAPRITWLVCSSENCRNLTHGQFLNVLKSSAGSELICKYRAQNEFGVVQSREVIIRMSRVHPACPSREVELAYTVFRTARNNSNEAARNAAGDGRENDGYSNKSITISNELSTNNCNDNIRGEICNNNNDRYNGSDSNRGIIPSDQINSSNSQPRNGSTMNSTESKNGTSSETNLKLELEVAFKELVYSRLRSVTVKRQSVDANNRIMSALLTLDCSTSNDTRENTTKSSALNERISQAVDNLRLVVENSYQLVTIDHTKYSFNPAYLRLEKTEFTCPEEWESKETYRCVKQPEKLILDPPGGLEFTTTGTSAMMAWEAPFYAKHFATGFTVVITQQHDEETTQFYNISSTATTFTFDPSMCYDGCNVKVRVYTESQHSAWASTEVIFVNTFDLEPSSSQAADFIWVVIVCVVVIVFISVSIVGAYLTNRKSNKIKALPRYTDDKDAGVFSTRTSGHQKQVRWADHCLLLDGRPDVHTDERTIEQEPRASPAQHPVWDQTYIDSVGVYDCMPRSGTPMAVLAADVNAQDTPFGVNGWWKGYDQ